MLICYFWAGCIYFLAKVHMKFDYPHANLVTKKFLSFYCVCYFTWKTRWVVARILGLASSWKTSDIKAMEVFGETSLPWISLLYNFIEFPCLLNFEAIYFSPLSSLAYSSQNFSQDKSCKINANCYQREFWQAHWMQWYCSYEIQTFTPGAERESKLQTGC